METSNLQFKSNLYVLSNGHKNSQEFVSKVSDAKTLLHIYKSNPNLLIDWQREFAKQGMSCALAKKARTDNPNYVEVVDHHTHGIVTENGNKVCVCKCQHEECSQYDNCSSREDFRRVAIRYEHEKPVPQPLPTVSDKFTYDEPPRVVKITPQIQSVVPPIQPNILHIDNPGWYSYKGWKEQHGVRGHWRTLQDGTTTWVREHTRGGEKGIFEHPDNFIGGRSQPTVTSQSHFVEPEYIDNGEFEDCEFTPDYVIKNLIKIDDADRIIRASIDERVLVNGGAGTGKTHTVIQRLKYILENNLAAPDSIMVLCFSRAAVKVIRKRLKDEILSGGLHYDAEEIGVRTFDSFATWYLKETDQSINLQYDDYDARIKRFNSKFLQSPRELDDALNYLIVDEIQDLVGDRAEMVRCLLDKISCGFMLLGDQCQAIYDYQITDEQELNAARFFEWLDSKFGDNIKKYELMKNHRQQNALQNAIMPLRTAMLTDGIKRQKRELKRIVDRYNLKDMSADDIIECCKGNCAILSWSNGDAYTQSQKLYLRKKPIEHLLLSSSRKITFRKEIAILLSLYREKTLAERKFIDLASENGIDQATAKVLWNALHKLDSRQTGFVDLERVRQQLLWESSVDDVLISTNDSSVTISTIHKAKGKEYDEVLINLSPIKSKASKNDFAEIKVYYVALTRAKSENIVKINKPSYDEKTRTGRHIKCGQGTINGYNKVLKYELGLDGDINLLSFVDRKLFGGDEAVRKNQEYIRYYIRRGDRLSVWLEGGLYKIFHNERVIGSMNPLAFEKFKQTFRSGKSFTHNLAEYNRFDDIYVSDIVTVVNKGIHANIAEPYSKSGFWLGIDFCGYSRPMEE